MADLNKLKQLKQNQNMVDIARTVMPANGVVQDNIPETEEVDASQTNQFSTQGQSPLQARVKDPNINYDNISQGKAAVARIDSPEYKAQEQDINNLRSMMDLYKNRPDKLEALNQQMAAKKAALDKIRSGK